MIISQDNLQPLKSAMKMGQEISSKVREPAICPAKVEVKDVTKTAKVSMEPFAVLRFFRAVDCSGEARIRKPTIWNHINGGYSQTGPTKG